MKALKSANRVPPHDWKSGASRSFFGEIAGEIQVKVKDSKASGGYVNIGWLAAKAKMESPAISD